MSHWDDYSEKEWDEPGPDFGRMIYTNRVTGHIEFETDAAWKDRWS